MHSKKELRTNLEIIRRKKRDILNSTRGSDIEYLRNLQTLTRLEAAAEEALELAEKDAE